MEKQEVLCKVKSSVEVNSNESDDLIEALATTNQTKIETYIEKKMGVMSQLEHDISTMFRAESLKATLDFLRNQTAIGNLAKFYLKKDEYSGADEVLQKAFEEFQDDLWKSKTFLTDLQTYQIEAKGHFEVILNLLNNWLSSMVEKLKMGANLRVSSVKQLTEELDKLKDLVKKIEDVSDFIKSLNGKNYHKILSNDVFPVSQENTIESIYKEEDYLKPEMEYRQADEEFFNLNLKMQILMEENSLLGQIKEDLNLKKNNLEAIRESLNQEGNELKQTKSKNLEKLRNSVNENEEKRKQLETQYIKQTEETKVKALERSNTLTDEVSKLAGDIKGITNLKKDFHIIGIIDHSLSMDSYLPGCSATRFQAVTNCYDKIIKSRASVYSEDIASAIVFHDTAKTLFRKESVKKAPKVKQGQWGGTVYESALIELDQLLDSNPSNYTPIIFFLTDGANYGNNQEARRLITSIREKFAVTGMILFCVGIDDCDLSFLKELCSIANGGKLYVEVGLEKIDLLHTANNENEIHRVFDSFLAAIEKKTSLIKCKKDMLLKLKEDLFKDSHKTQDFINSFASESKKIFEEIRKDTDRSTEHVEGVFSKRIKSLQDECLEIDKKIEAIDFELNDVSKKKENNNNEINKIKKEIPRKKQQIEEIEKLLEKTKEILMQKKAKSQDEIEQNWKETITSLQNKNIKLSETRVRNLYKYYQSYVYEAGELRKKMAELTTFIVKITRLIDYFANNLVEELNIQNHFNPQKYFDYLVRYYHYILGKNGLEVGKITENFNSIIEYCFGPVFSLEMSHEIDILKKFSPVQIIKEVSSEGNSEIQSKVKKFVKKDKDRLEEELNRLVEERNDLMNPVKESGEIINKINKLKTRLNSLEQGVDDRENDEEEEEKQKEEDEKKEGGLKKKLKDEEKKYKSRIEMIDQKLEEDLEHIEDEIRKIKQDKSLDYSSKKPKIKELQQDKKNADKEAEDEKEKEEKKFEKEKDKILQQIKEGKKEQKNQKDEKMKS